MSAAKTTEKSAKSTNGDGFTAAERAAMQARAKELKAEARASKNREAGERDVLAAIAEMPDADRVLGERIHAIVTATAPALAPKTWYGMPAYAQDGKVLCFFQAAAKFGARYATIGFNDVAALDDGTMWPTAFALTELTPDTEARIAALVKQAVG